MLILLLSTEGNFIDTITLSESKINSVSTWIQNENPTGISCCGAHAFEIKNSHALDTFREKIASIA